MRVVAQLHPSQLADGLGYGVSVEQGRLRHHRRESVRSQPPRDRQQRPARTPATSRAYNYVLEGGYTEGDRSATGISTSTCTAGRRRLRRQWRESASRSRSTPFAAIRTTSSASTRARPSGCAARRRSAPTFTTTSLVHGNRGEAVRIEESRLLGLDPHRRVGLLRRAVPPRRRTEHVRGRHDRRPGRGRLRRRRPRRRLPRQRHRLVVLERGASTEWRFLQASSLAVRALRFGRFDADLKTDVLFSDGHQLVLLLGWYGGRRWSRATTASRCRRARSSATSMATA